MAFKIDRRDIDFVLYEYLEADKKLSTIDKYKDYGKDDYDMALTESHKFCRDVIMPLNEVGDKKGVLFDKGKVTLPDEYKAAYNKYVQSGWSAVSGTAEYGGGGFPQVITAGIKEPYTGACVSFMFTFGLTLGNCLVIETYGNEAQKATYCEKLTTGQWTGTMCLTEPGAGTAVGDLTTKAVRNGDSYLISGTKCFITSAEHDYTDNIIHLVLARIEGAPKGVKGVSLFIVPKNRVNPDGSIGESNDVACGGIEHKMGLHGSPTCVMNFGENNNCQGYLLGEENKGIVYMFLLMNEARISCGIQGMAQGAACYEYARKYVYERIQGTDIRSMKDPDAPRVAIVEHPDIRRNLMIMKSYVEGLRALIYYTALQDDLLHSPDKTERELASDRLELLTPIVKAYGTDIGFHVADTSIMVHGGYGYSSEYPVEQQLRDVKASAIYEGVNGIQALDLVGRKLRMKGGMVLMSYMMEINQFIAANEKHTCIADIIKQLSGARDQLVACVTYFTKKGAENLLIPVLNASPFLKLAGHVTIAYHLAKQAVVAHEKLAAIFDEKNATDDESKSSIIKESPNATFYSNKIKTARFFCHNQLQEVYGLAGMIQSGDTSALDASFDY